MTNVSFAGESPDTTAGPLIAASGIVKAYGGNVVLRGIDFTLGRGEIVALLGENGAGKSTLAKILTGAVRPDRGTLEIAGRSSALHAPRDALRRGVSLIPQELASVPEMTVAENLTLNGWPSRAGVTSARAIEERAEQAIAGLGLQVDVRRRMATLKLADRQIVEILKAVVRDARVLVLDEPTAALSAVEAEALFTLLRRLVRRGVGIVYISHRLDEIFAISDRIDVLRDGAKVFSGAAASTAPDELIGHMLGYQPAPHAAEERAAATRPAALTVRDWRTAAGSPQLDGVGFAVGRGEVLGIFGARGSGAELIADGLAGRARGMDGTLALDGYDGPVFRSPRERQRHGVAYLPPDRRHEALFATMSVREHVAYLVPQQVSRFGVLSRRREARLAAAQIADFGIRASDARQRVGELSGGNQQKVLLAARLATGPQIVVLSEPTRGVDVGARTEIHRRLRALAAGGVAIVVVTSDVEEAVDVSDRVLVIRRGRVACELAGTEQTQHRILQAASLEVAA